MAVLEGETLGEKHRHYNKLLTEAIDNKKVVESGDFNSGEGDVDKLMKIDIASNNRNVEYILEVLKSDDMLYVSRAIRRCPWLVTDPQYAHVINSDYLHTQLFPQMITKASNKFIKHIRLHLKDEARVEGFCTYENDIKKAAKWLPNCSATFIESNILKYANSINNIRLLKRITEKSTKALEMFIQHGKCSPQQSFAATKFLLNIDAGRYLDLVEQQRFHNFPKFGGKTTETLMKKFHDRIIDKIDEYCTQLHLATFVRFLGAEDVKKVLYTLANKKHRHMRYLHNFNILKELINTLPEEERFSFVDQVFINKIHTEKDDNEKSDLYRMRQLYLIIIPRIPAYKFYEFSPFDTAFTEIKKLIQAESSPDVKSSMFGVLINSCGNNLQNTRTLLQYYRDKYNNDHIEQKHKFIKQLISETEFHKYEEDTWNILDDIYKSMNVYIESDVYKQEYLETIILYKVLHGGKVPEIVEKQFQFNTLMRYQKKLNQEEKDKIFNYLYKYAFEKVQSHNIANEKSEFEKAITLLEKVLDVLNDWKRDLIDYQPVLDKIKEFVKIKKDNSWNTNLSSMYNKNKSWKKHMFAESLVLNPCEEVCINSLKHGPNQLANHKSEVEALCRDDKVSLQYLLSKLRIYWPESLASEWTQAYLGRLDHLGGHKALLRGLCVLLLQQPLLEIIKKYAPQEAEIDWNKTNELELSIQRHIAKNMHFARPQPPPDAVLLFAKGDYLQYALPSLLAIFYNMTVARTRECIARLLDSPVSVQKHGIRIAFVKLTADELKTVFPDIWKVTKNASIRSVIFKLTYDLLCKENDPTRITSIWEILTMFVDSLSYEEDKRIYELFTRNKVQNVPKQIKGEYLVKSYEFLKRFIANLTEKDKQQYMYELIKLAEYTAEMIEDLPPKFVSDIIVEYIDEKFLKGDIEYDNNLVPVISAYLLHTKDEKIQTERYVNILLPLIQLSIVLWDKMEKKCYFIRQNFRKLLGNLGSELKYVVSNSTLIPITMFLNIQKELIQLPVSENYMMLTAWKLSVELTKLIETNKSVGVDWDTMWPKMHLDFGDACLRVLKEDVKLYFPCIYLLFSRNLNAFLSEFVPQNSRWEIYKRMTMDEEAIEAYLAVIKQFPQYIPDEEKVMAGELRKILKAHPSVEIKMHYYHKFKNEAF